MFFRGIVRAPYTSATVLVNTVVAEFAPGTYQNYWRSTNGAVLGGHYDYNRVTAESLLDDITTQLTKGVQPTDNPVLQNKITAFNELSLVATAVACQAMDCMDIPVGKPPQDRLLSPIRQLLKIMTQATTPCEQDDFWDRYLAPDFQASPVWQSQWTLRRHYPVIIKPVDPADYPTHDEIVTRGGLKAPQLRL